MTENTSPSKSSLEAAEKMIDAETSGEHLICGPDQIDITQEVIEVIARLLDSTSRQLAKEVMENVKSSAGGEPCDDCAHPICIGRRITIKSVLTLLRSKGLVK